jgi:hypothetical protein
MPLAVVWEADGRLAGILRPFAEVHRWEMREVGDEDEAMRWLARGGPGVLVLRLGRDVEREMALLARVGWALPDADAVVVAEEGQERLAGLAWDMGAAFVLTPPRARDDLPEIAVGLLGGRADDAAGGG